MAVVPASVGAVQDRLICVTPGATAASAVGLPGGLPVLASPRTAMRTASLLARLDQLPPTIPEMETSAMLKPLAFPASSSSLAVVSSVTFSVPFLSSTTA